MGKAAIYNPYLDTLGGGERYTLSFARVLLDLGWNVDLEWRDPEIKRELLKRFGINLEGVEVVSDVKRGDGYDLCFWVSDGSIPTLHSRKNILHFQVPFHDVGGWNLLNKMKLWRIDKVVCNSHFTKKVIDKEFRVNSLVVYPPVPVGDIHPKRKEDIILSVGRFSNLKQSKRQDVLIEAFKKLIKEDFAGWKLILAGGVEVGDGGYTDLLLKKAEGLPVEIIKSPDFSVLKDLYGKAKIFWSASGFEENEEKNPEKVEHFGMSVVEAMSAGAIPVVYNAGGHREIIKNGVNGFLWNKTGELIRKTKEAVNFRTGIAKAATASSEKYSYEEFRKNITEIL